MKSQLMRVYVEVYELENESGYLVKTRAGKWLVLDASGKEVQLSTGGGAK